MHYVQDLSQPFHSAQIPSLAMVPWSALLEWPPAQAFASLVKETNRTISNYHYAYEGYTLSRLQLDNPSNPFLECLEKPRDHAQIHLDRSAVPEPQLLARAVASASIDLAPEVGSAVVDFFGDHLKGAEFDLPNEKGKVDYADMGVRPDKTRERQRLQEVTCRALANGIFASQRLIEWAYRP